MYLYITITASLLLNGLLLWYLSRLLKKFLFLSESLSDLFLMMKAYGVFVKSLYSMDNYHGEPYIQELVIKTREVIDEVENFRQIFEHTLDEELEEELDAAEKEIEK
jgi:hypothetical protein